MTQLAEIFDKHESAKQVFQAARDNFEKWAALDAPNLPENAIDAMQVKLLRWQNEKFGVQSDERLALGVIEEVTEADIAQKVADTIDGLGDCCVYASQLATNNRLAILPIFMYADAMRRVVTGQLMAEPMSFKNQETGEEMQVPAIEVWGYQLVVAMGALGQTVLKGAQKVRGLDDKARYQQRLVGTLAVCIARCALAVDMKSGEDPIDITEVFRLVGEEVSQRGAGHEAIPKLTIH